MKMLFYGRSADWIGCRELSLAVAGSKALHDVLEEAPKLWPILEHKDTLLVSVNCQVRAIDTTVQDTDEVAFLPPFEEG